MGVGWMYKDLLSENDPRKSHSFYLFLNYFPFSLLFYVPFLSDITVMVDWA